RGYALGLALLLTGSLGSAGLVLGSMSGGPGLWSFGAVREAADPAPALSDAADVAPVAPEDEDADPATLAAADDQDGRQAHEPATPVEAAMPARVPDPARLAGGPFPDRPEPDPALEGASFRAGEPGFWAGLRVGARADYDLLVEIWSAKGAARGWHLPDYSH